MADLPTALSVKVIIHDPQGNVLLLKRSRHCQNNAGKWEFAGGKVDTGENFEQALLREVKEETGLTIDLKGSVGTSESKRAKPPVVYLVMEGQARTTKVRLSDEHKDFQWAAPAILEEIPLCPQFRRIARRYAQEVAIEPRVRKRTTLAKEREDLFKDSVVKPDSLAEALQTFNNRRPKYAKLAEWLARFLRSHVLSKYPLAEVSARPKDQVSFAAKLINKDKYKDPLREVTDLVGARIVLHLQTEVDAVCRWIESQFEIDKANSGDKAKDLGADKFGYRSVHYVVEMRRGRPAGIPRSLAGLKAEIQVRTIAQHAWSDIGHDRVYKAECDIPDYWKREANRISALLEAADDAFARLVEGVGAFRDHVRQTPNEAAARRLIQLWDVVRKKWPKDPRPALRIAHLAREIDDWAKVLQVVKNYKGDLNARLQCARGFALCRKAGNHHAREWKDGIASLEKASRLSSDSIEPHLRLGQLLAPVDPARALRHYERAFSIDSSNPAALVGYIRCKVLEEKTVAFIPLLQPEIKEAIRRSEELAAAGADLPHALYRIGGFHLLLGRDHCHKSLDWLARAVHHTLAPDPLVQTLRDVSQLADYAHDRADVDCARRFLAAALVAKFRKRRWPADVRRPATSPLKPHGPVVIVAGGCEAYHQKAMKDYGPLLARAFADYRGLVISGGTREGISGVVGALAEQSGGRICAVGYLPQRMPTDNTATEDNRYRIRRTGGDRGFSARQPIQNWLDLLAAGIHPSQVRLLGINGGNIAGLEYRIAVALGATVGVIEGSGREAERVLNDWPARPPAPDDDRGIRGESDSGGQTAVSPGRLIPLPPDPTTLRAFLHMGDGKHGALSAQAVEDAARLVHKDFLEQQRYSHPDPVMQPWPKLRGDLRSSNKSQIKYLVSILRACGFDVQAFSGTPNDPKFTDDESKKMGEMEHGRWNIERLQSGWRYAKRKDSQKRLSPYLVSWKKLHPDTRKWDFLNVRLWPEILAEVGYEIVRIQVKA